MRNLKLTYHDETLLFPSSLAGQSNLAGRPFITLDFDSGLTFVGRGRHVAGLGDGGKGADDLESDQSGLCVRWRCELALKETDAIVGIHWSLENEALVVATAEGNLLLLKPPVNFDDVPLDHLIDDYEEVGCIASGCRCMAVSPDEELLLLLTGDSTFVLMTSADCDPVVEAAFADEDQKQSEAFVNVGWGKKETQFHGSEGKAAASASKALIRGNEALSPYDAGDTRLCWRADGQHFAVSFIQGKPNPAGGDAPQDLRRVIRVFSRDGTLFSSSEDVPGLEQTLHWRPSGSLLASSVRRPNKHEIAFFEPNGLRHGQFTLPFNTDRVKVVELCWNPNSDILAVVLEENSSDLCSSPATVLQLWTCGNYHWYLKQSLVLHRNLSSSEKSTSAALLWDSLTPHRLHLVGGDGVYRTFEWTLAVDRSNSTSPLDLAQVSVIDGDCVKLTPFRLMNVPPPMAAYEIKLPFFVNSLATNPWSGEGEDSLVNSLAVVGTKVESPDILLNLYESAVLPPPPTNEEGEVKQKRFKPRATPLQLTRAFEIQTDELSSRDKIAKGGGVFPCHVTRVSPNVFLFVTSGRDIWSLETPATNSVESSPGQEAKPVQVRPAHCFSVSSSFPGETIRSMRPSLSTSSGAVVQFSSGQFRHFDLETNSFEDSLAIAPEVQRQPADDFMLVNFSSSSPSIISLTNRGVLSIDGDIRISDSATSMSLHRDFLLYTTTKHELVALRLRTSDGSSALPAITQIATNRGVSGGVGTGANGDTPERRFVQAGVAVTRSVERGARLVVCCATETGVVLQMPRGNLETIHPRALLLSCVERLLYDGRYAEAVALMRRHRLNMNLVHDHNPTKFFDRIEDFLAKVEDPQLINLFLTDLEDKDVCSTMYEDYFRGRPSLGGSEIDSNKVNSICDAMIEAMKKKSSSHFLTSILTAMAKKSPPEIAGALTELRAAQLADEKTADAALKYFASLVDVDRLFDEALGTYDLRCVVMVAEKSQKDPKEYLPFLNGLRAMDENMRKYTIDLHLKRWDKALNDIHACGDLYFDTHLLPLVETHTLYSEALALFDRKSPNYKTISSKFGAFLTKKRRYREAGVVLSRVGDYEPAMRAFQLANDWRQMICVAAYLKLSPPEMAALARVSAESLKAVDMAEEAAVLLADYADDVEEAIVILIEGRQWDEALRVMHKHGRIDFIESDFKDAILSSAEEQMAAISALKGEFVRHSERLVIARKEKWETAKRRETEEDAGLYGDDRKRGGKDDDLYSDASSMSGVSDATSKSTRSNASSSFTKITERNANRAVKRKEKKMRSLKEGGEYEHLALVEALHTILVNVEKLKPEVDRLLKVLTQFFFDDQSLRLSSALEDFQTLIDASVKRIWPPNLSSAGQGDAFNEDSFASVGSNLSASFDRLRLGPTATANSIAQNYSSASFGGGGSMPLHPDKMDFHLLPPHLQHPPSAMMILNGGKGREEEFRMDVVAGASSAIVHRSRKATEEK